MSNNKQLFTHDSVDAQIDAYLRDNGAENTGEPEQQLVLRLQKYYQPRQEHDLALKRVQARLEHLQSAGAENNEDMREQPTAPSMRPGQFKVPHLEARRRFSRRLSLLAAVALVALLLSGSLFVLRQGRAQTPGLANQQTPTKTPGTQQNTPTQLYAFSVGFSARTDADSRTLYRLDPTSGQALWHFTMKAETDKKGEKIFAAFGTLQVVNGILYFQGTDTDGIYIYAVNVTTGTLVWKSLRGEGETDPLVANGMVYVTQSSSGGGFILALNAQNGQQVWKRPYTGSGTSYIDNLQVVAATSSTLYVTTYRLAQEQSLLYALNAQTGALLWQKEIAHPEMISQGKIAGNTLYLASEKGPNEQGQGAVSAYDLATGNQLWSTAMNGSVSAFAVEQNTLYAITFNKNQHGSDLAGSIYALRASDGKILWQQHPNRQINGMIVADGEVYLNTAEVNAIYTSQTIKGANGQDKVTVNGPPWQLEALNGADGDLTWQQTMPASVGGLPLVIGDDIYLVSMDSTIVVIDRSTGKQIKTIATTDSGLPLTGIMLFAI